MKERPILFSGPMVRALLDGRKRQTRRILKLRPGFDLEERDDGRLWPWAEHPERCDDVWMPCPYGQPGDRLWVRESGAMHALLAPEDPLQPMLFRHDVPTTENLGDYWVQRTRAPGASYSTECTREQFLRHTSAKVVPSIHMPRWASRISLEIISVRVERLQDISEADAIAEGVAALHGGNMWTAGGMHDGPLHAAKPCGAYRRLWESINGPDSWGANPLVWVIDFGRVSA